ncbi:tRNA (adenosine(37)-N6)-threonylcarbamoyltransferase complex ATPase subunit type 1 TsaE [Mucilaginibacter ginsenosidivorans]|uniref:tRNA threonylcarbamoyladenosine biosynthesis protein TsaE n=1 Tax=Mucilaginibacter ginsenosidivorans TaxID=398053 RepID=A0A5B8UUN8_9SPHI|nr:tRNA (adenosine(37)-N6)-threonylcarbamoyltransferase complex ATPase subunit type 1 TsaE [Mucilaginibacter ginsenosidivorans]QEC62598.1 tRNA (adenosine(37)-N6)-threonylcarbamoyltransferase complex ATPase subunit type 1 TsaE [Mucilaginibacter ginsenosidivorans]
MELPVKNINELRVAAEKLIVFAGNEKIFLFYGDMGAGKTTFIKSLCRCLGVTEQTSSPTFSIINEYQATALKIYHFDFYRLKKEDEALDMGYEEYFYSGNYCFIEWPEKIAGLLPDHYIRVDINVLNNGERLLTFTKI